MPKPSMTFLSPMNCDYINYLVQWCYIFDSPLHQLSKTMGLHQWLDRNSPQMTEFYNDYIMGLYMTLTSKEKYDIYIYPKPRPQQ